MSTFASSYQMFLQFVVYGMGGVAECRNLGWKPAEIGLVFQCEYWDKKHA